MSTQEKGPKVEALKDSVDIRLADLQPEFYELAKENGLTKEQADDFWTYIRAGYGSGWTDHRSGIEFPGYPSENIQPTPDVNEANDGFRQILSVRLRQPFQD